MNLIVVDDESDVQFLFQQKFRKEIKSGSVIINFAIDGVSALNLLASMKDHADCLILSDINMPQMTGLELLKEIKSKYPNLKVIIITAYGDEYNFRKAKELGAEDYFTKPLEFDSLKNRLNQIEIK